MQNNQQQAVQTLFLAANQNTSLTLTAFDVREIASLLVGMDGMLGAYVERYGTALAEELTAGEVVEAEVVTVDPEVTEEGYVNEETFATGLSGEESGLDAPNQEEE